MKALFLVIILVSSALSYSCGEKNEENKMSFVAFCNTFAQAICDRYSSCKLLGSTTFHECYVQEKAMLDCSEGRGECPEDMLYPCTYDFMNSIACSDFRDGTFPDLPHYCKGICSE